ncbi:ANR family transcriptional regulator [Pasteurella oralis]|uniref:ANR family transcriptional regulator n=1 Tax=Pasteurella oralis TaxID=1071947 RepID=A0ABW4NTH9_9PAST
MNTHFNRFQHYSSRAAKAERAGKYELARSHWEVAAISAKQPFNQDWCIKRAEFCQRMLTKPFVGNTK